MGAPLLFQNSTQNAFFTPYAPITSAPIKSEPLYLEKEIVVLSGAKSGHALGCTWVFHTQSTKSSSFLICFTFEWILSSFTEISTQIKYHYIYNYNVLITHRYTKPFHAQKSFHEYSLKYTTRSLHFLIDNHHTHFDL